MSTVWQIYNHNRKQLKNDLDLLLEAAHAVEWLGNRKAPLLLKPNLVVSKSASEGATTHPEIAEAVVEYFLDCGFSDIAVAEGSWVGDSTARAFEVCGYTDIRKRYGIRLIDLQKDFFTEKAINGDNYKICSSIYDLAENGGSLINLPVLKGHGQTHISCALKNLKGCIPDSEKRRYHTLGVHGPVALLNTMIKPAFALVDGLNGDPYWEEGGSPEKRDILLLGRDPVAIDSYACSLLDVDEDSVDYIGMAEKLGVGTAGTSASDIIHLGPRPGNVKGQKRPGSNSGSGKIAGELKNLIDQLTEQRSACSSCFGNLAGALRDIYAEDPALLGPFEKGSICIGQEFRDNPPESGKTGIGICTAGGKGKFLRGCPPSKRAVYDFLKNDISGGF